jgi:4,5-dihydroxyphthalate decarboxylase
MHVVVIRRSLAERHPWLAPNVFRGFAEAKRLAIHDLEQTNFLRVTLPWIDLDAVRGLMGHDYWPYGLATNRPELESAIRWSVEEGLSPRSLDPTELFDAETLELER